MAQVIVTIDAEGGVKTQVQGVCGPECRQLSAGIEDALGEVVQDAPTAEMFQQTTQTQTTQTQGARQGAG